MKRPDHRVHGHAAWWAFILHRISGLLLALFLPIHFWLLGTALAGAATLDAALRFTEAPIVKIAEWGLVVLLALHLGGGTRLLLIEFSSWSGLRKDWIAGTVAVTALVGLVYALALTS